MSASLEYACADSHLQSRSLKLEKHISLTTIITLETLFIVFSVIYRRRQHGRYVFKDL